MELIGSERDVTVLEHLAYLAREVRRAGLSATVDPNHDPFPSLAVESTGERTAIVVGSSYYWWDHHGDFEVVGPVSALDDATRAVVQRLCGASAARACASTLGTYAIAAVSIEVAPARRWLSGLLTDGYAAVVDDVVLLTSEVVTNSVLHSDSAIGDPGVVTLIVLDVGDAVRVEVTDPGSDTKVPRMVDDGLDAVNGRGLHMLDFLSGGRWGSHTDDGGRTVWFEVATAPLPPSP
jgi:anti-sigma regulatory factor (Ser/Thr protein kinase)